MKVRLTISICFLMLASSIIFSQSPRADTMIVVPGDGTVSAKRFFDYENIWVMTEEDSAGVVSPIGIWYDTVRIVLENKRVLIRKQVVNYTNGHIRKHYDKVDCETMLPMQVRVVAQQNAGAIEQIITDLTYQDSSFSGIRRFNIEGSGPENSLSANVNVKLKEPIFDWHMWGILISSFPLRENYAAQFMVHTSTGTTNSPFLWVTLKVTGSDLVESDRWGRVDCWRVLVHAEVPWTFWISKKGNVAPIQMIKIDQTVLGGNIAWWKAEQ